MASALSSSGVVASNEASQTIGRSGGEDVALERVDRSAKAPRDRPYEPVSDIGPGARSPMMDGPSPVRDFDRARLANAVPVQRRVGVRKHPGHRDAATIAATPVTGFVCSVEEVTRGKRLTGDVEDLPGGASSQSPVSMIEQLRPARVTHLDTVFARRAKDDP